MTAYHLEIRSIESGRTLCAADVEVSKVEHIEGVLSGDSVGILRKGETVAVGYPTIAEAKARVYELLRWKLGGKGDPVATAIY